MCVCMYVCVWGGDFSPPPQKHKSFQHVGAYLTHNHIHPDTCHTQLV